LRGHGYDRCRIQAILLRICSAEYIRLVDQRTAMLDLILSKSLFVRPRVP